MARARSPGDKHPPAHPLPLPSKAPAPRFDGDESALVVMGRILGPFGIQGWVKLKTFTETPDGLADHPAWWVRRKEGWIAMQMEDFKVRPAATSAKLEGCDDRNAAELLRGCDVAVTREALGDAGEGSLYWVDLVGLEVRNLEGEDLGRVDGLVQTGAADVLVVKDGGRERLIPFVDGYVKSVDRKAGRITVDWGADY